MDCCRIVFVCCGGEGQGDATRPTTRLICARAGCCGGKRIYLAGCSKIYRWVSANEKALQVICVFCMLGEGMSRRTQSVPDEAGLYRSNREP